MYVNIQFMDKLSQTDGISSKWWYLWNSNPCCLFKKNTNKKENAADKSQDTRNKILIAAFNEIYKRGFQAASISNILKNTGTTKGALYHHFNNKQELGYTVLDEVIGDTIRATWIEPLRHTDDPLTVLINIIYSSGKQITQEDVSLGCPLNNLAQEMSPIDDGFKDRIAAIYQEWETALETSCDRGKVAGNVVDSIDSKEISLLFIASLQGCMGFAKSVQSLDTLMSCGQGLIDRIESLRPSKNSII